VRVKIFEEVSYVEPNQSRAVALEKKINEWLAANQSIEILDMRLTMSSSPAQEFGHTVGLSSTVCLILYREGTEQ
jgi:hypothetical protein